MIQLNKFLALFFLFAPSSFLLACHIFYYYFLLMWVGESIFPTKEKVRTGEKFYFLS